MAVFCDHVRQFLDLAYQAKAMTALCRPSNSKCILASAFGGVPQRWFLKAQISRNEASGSAEYFGIFSEIFPQCAHDT